MQYASVVKCFIIVFFITNEEVLTRVGEPRTILETIMARKKKWIGHNLKRLCPCYILHQQRVDEGCNWGKNVWETSKRETQDRNVTGTEGSTIICSNEREGIKQEKMESVHAKNLPNGRTPMMMNVSLNTPRKTKIDFPSFDESKLGVLMAPSTIALKQHNGRRSKWEQFTLPQV